MRPSSLVSPYSQDVARIQITSHHPNCGQQESERHYLAITEVCKPNKSIADIFCISQVHTRFSIALMDSRYT